MTLVEQIQLISSRFRWLLFLLGLAVIALYLSITWLWQEVKGKFPNLPAGVYLGSVKGVLDSEKQLFINVYQNLTDEQDKREQHNGATIDAAIISPGFSSTEFNLESFKSNVNPTDSLKPSLELPLKLSSGGDVIVFHGIKISNGHYKGEAISEKTSKLGTWELALADFKQVLNKESENNLRTWLNFLAQSNAQDQKVAELNAEIEQQNAEQRKVSEALMEAKTLKDKADKKLSETNTEFASSREVLAAKQEKLNALINRWELAKQFTESGRITSLSREISELENNWIINQR